jgi:hypothetical protein
MGYTQLIDSNLALAFRLVKDLATDVQLVEKDVGEFNFSDSTIPATASTTKNIKAVVIDTKKKSDIKNVLKKEILIQSRNISDLTIYDSVIISGVTWKFGPILANNNFTILAEIYREIGNG